jgi:hypothetical protein
MVTIEKYQISSGQCVTGSATAHPTTGRRKNEASSARSMRSGGPTPWKSTKMTGEYIAPSLGRITVAELGPEWLTRKKQHTAPPHYWMFESAWPVHVSPRWGKVAVADVDLRRGSPAW